MRVEDASLPQDAGEILALNNAAVPAVNTLDEAALTDLVAIGRLRLARDDSGTLMGFILTLPPRRTYGSLNYRWFDERFAEFLYIDRIVVAEAARGLGVGSLLYEETIAEADAMSAGRVCSEVNLDPPNPGSMRFHERLGFTGICARLNPAEGKTVAMMVRELAHPTTAAA